MDYNERFRRLLLTSVFSTSAIIAATANSSASSWTAGTFANSGVRGFSTTNDFSVTSMNDLAATGANVLRHIVVICPSSGNSIYNTYDNINGNCPTIDMASATTYTYDPTALATAVAAATQYGFKLLPALNDPNNTSTDYQLWGDQNGNATSQSATLQASLNAIWRDITTTYSGNSNIAAYDLFNEPVATDGETQWEALATKLINTIRAIDPDRVIVFEPSPWGGPYAFTPALTPLPFTNLVYELHDYMPDQIAAQGLDSTYTTQETYPTAGDPIADCSGVFGCQPLGASNYATLTTVKDLGGVIAFQQKFNIPIYVGEFSCIRWAPIAPFNSLPTAYNWVAESLSLYESLGWSYSYAAWRSWYGWDAEMPESLFYQYPYVNAEPNISQPTFNDIIGNPGKYRVSNSDTIQLLMWRFRSNVH